LFGTSRSPVYNDQKNHPVRVIPRRDDFPTAHFCQRYKQQHQHQQQQQNNNKNKRSRFRKYLAAAVTVDSRRVVSAEQFVVDNK